MTIWQLPSFKRIGPEQFTDLFKNTPIAILGQFVNSTIVALALYHVTSQAVIVSWWLINFGMCMWMAWRWYRNRHRVITRISRKSIPRAMVYGFLYALPWSLLVILYLGEIPHREELMMGVAVIGMAASGSVQLARIYPAALVYLGTILLPVLIKSIMLADIQYYLLAGLSFSYIIYLISIISSSANTSIERSAALSDLKIKVQQLDQANDALEKLAKIDDLTGMPNRRALYDHIAGCIAQADQNDDGFDKEFYVLLCDLDHFKNVNDTAGHAAGDELLRKIAALLQQNINNEDFAARLGGDEFAIIVKNQKNLAAIKDFVGVLIDHTKNTLKFDEESIDVGISIGVSNYPKDAQTPEALLSLADIALQRGKAVARGRYWFFDENLRTKLSSDSRLEADLREAIANKQFELFYQPKVDIASGRLRGFESLLRWRRSNGKIETPDSFLPLASERGLILQISDLVIEKAIEDFTGWREMGLDPGELSINIHPSQIRDRQRMERLVQDIDEVAIPPEKIILEITEDCVIGRGTDEVPDLLGFLRKHNFKISFDDFGTGYASLTHLKTLPVDEIKLDRSFIRGLDSNLEDRTIVRSMIELVSLLELSTVAEGIENQEQHNILLAMGCATGQGYYYSRPMNLKTASKYLQNAVTIRSGTLEHVPNVVDISPDSSDHVRKMKIQNIR